MHWFVVASQQEARCYIKTKNEASGRPDLKLLVTVENPLGTEKKHDLVKKEAGQNQHEQAVIQFARELSDFFDKERLKKSYDSLTLFAEPKFMGKIKAEMSEDLQKLVSDWIQKDLQKTPHNKLIEHLLNSGDSQYI